MSILFDDPGHIVVSPVVFDELRANYCATRNAVVR